MSTTLAKSHTYTATERIESLIVGLIKFYSKWDYILYWSASFLIWRGTRTCTPRDFLPLETKNEKGNLCNMHCIIFHELANFRIYIKNFKKFCDLRKKPNDGKRVVTDEIDSSIVSCGPISTAQVNELTFHSSHYTCTPVSYLSNGTHSRVTTHLFRPVEVFHCFILQRSETPLVFFYGRAKLHSAMDANAISFYQHW